MSQRLQFALEQGALTLPETGAVLVLHPSADTDLTGISPERIQIVHPMKPDHDHWAAQGYATAAELPEPRFPICLVTLPREKPLARHLIAQAMAQSDDLVIVDGDKTNGVDSLLKEMRRRGEVTGVTSKAHGKLFTLAPDPALCADWLAQPQQVGNGMSTLPGVFSADAVDPASALLAQALPEKLGKHVVDLGAGWGFLSGEVLRRDHVQRLDMVEANHIALHCARHNITDPRAVFHWADARAWKPAQAVDTVVMNPPFHTGRAADPALGQDFVLAAARCLAPSGGLYLVANRHLPYETTLAGAFAKVEEIAGDNRFKILHALRPKRQQGRRI